MNINIEKKQPRCRRVLILHKGSPQIFTYLKWFVITDSAPRKPMFKCSVLIAANTAPLWVVFLPTKRDNESAVAIDCLWGFSELDHLIGYE